MDNQNVETVGRIQRVEWMKPSEVAYLLRVDPKTVSRWAAAGKIASIRTPGGHRRFKASDVKAIMVADVS